MADDSRPLDDAPPLAEDDLRLLDEAAAGCRRLESELGKIIVGQKSIVRPALAAVFAGGHTLVVGVPGLAKTLLVKTLAAALGWSFKRIQFTPDMMPADIVGMELLHLDDATGARSMRFAPGPVFAQMILADEINRAPPKTQSALLEAMQEYQVTSLGKAHPLERPFLVFATQNPIEQEGTYPLPEAQLDRFMFSLWMDYPSADEEEEIVLATTLDAAPTVAPVFSVERALQFQHLVRRIPASRHVVKYAVALARSSRPGCVESAPLRAIRDYVSWGAGPRASQHMILAAKALAAIEGKPAVTAQHVRDAAPLVLRHRIAPNYNAAGEGVGSEQLVAALLKSVREPAYVDGKRSSG